MCTCTITMCRVLEEYTKQNSSTSYTKIYSFKRTVSQQKDCLFLRKWIVIHLVCKKRYLLQTVIWGKSIPRDNHDQNVYEKYYFPQFIYGSSFVQSILLTYFFLCYTFPIGSCAETLATMKIFSVILIIIQIYRQAFHDDAPRPKDRIMVILRRRKNSPSKGFWYIFLAG